MSMDLEIKKLREEIGLKSINLNQKLVGKDGAELVRELRNKLSSK
jgi:hypothetical protein